MSTTELTKRSSGGTNELLSRNLSIRSEGDMTDEKTVLNAEDKIGVYLVISSAIIDVAGVSLVVPILPYYAESFGADATQLGFLYSAFAASAVVATLVMGTLSDIFGRRKLIITSLFGSFSGFLFHGFCQNYNQLLAARIYTGFFSSSMTIAQAYIADVVPGPIQPKYMANLGAATGITFMVGPTVGGAVTAAANNDYSIPYFVAAFIAGIGMLFAFFKLKEPKKKRDDSSTEVEMPLKLSREQKIIEELLKTRLFGIPVVVYFLGIVRFCCQLGWTAQTSMFALFAMEKYGISAVYLSTMMMVGSVCYVISTVTLFKLLLAKFGLYNTLCCGMIIMAASLILFSVPGADGLTNLWLTFVLQWLLFVGFAIYMPSITSVFAKFTTPGERGKILGCGSVFMSSADIVGPILFGVLYKQDVDYVWYAGGGGLLVGCLLLRVIITCVKRRQKRIKQMLDDKVEEVEVEEDWQYEKDKEYTDEDYLLLGKKVGSILSHKNWRWVMKMVNVESVVEQSFPHIPDEVLKSRRMWDNFWSYSVQVWNEIKLVYSKRDEDYMIAQKNGWDFNLVEHVPVDLSIAYK